MVSVVVWPVLVLLALTLGGGPSLTLANKCHANVTVKGNDTKHIKEGNVTGNLMLYVKPKSGFHGISIEASSFKPSFTKDCFPKDGWYQLLLWVRSEKEGDNEYLYFGFIIDSCKKECKIQTSNKPKVFIVVAHGESEWIYENTKECGVKYPKDLTTNDESTCTITETTTITTTTSETTTLATTTSETSTNSSSHAFNLPFLGEVSKWTMISIPVVVVVMVVVMVVMVCRRMKSKTNAAPTPPQPTPPNTELHVMENDVYESLDNYNLTPSLVNEETNYIIENDIYEPFTGYDNGHE